MSVKIKTVDDIINKKKPEVRKKINKPDGDIINFYEIIPKKFLPEVDNPNKHIHNIELPFRMCVVAPSGSGKTNFLLNLLRVFGKGKGTFGTITIVTSNKDEPLYNWLESEFDQIKIVEGMSNTPKLDDMDKEVNNLVIWDDLVLNKKQDDVEKYYMRARKRNCSVIYLSQSYYDINKFIRKNSNYLVILNLGGSKREQSSILNEWSTDLDKDQLNAIYNDATSVPLRPLIIKGGKVAQNEKYRKGWTDYYNIKEFFKSNPINVKKSKSKSVYQQEEPSDDDSDYGY